MYLFQAAPRTILPTVACAIRLATPVDAPAMKRIAELAYRKYAQRLNPPPLPILFDYIEVAMAGNTYVFVRDALVVAMVTCIAEADHMLLRNLAVLPECQGVGIGGKLIDFLELEARRRTLSEVRLWTREEMSDNVQYCQRRGYVITHSAVIDGCTRIYFRKMLGALP